jgi:O-antigen ligase
MRDQSNIRAQLAVHNVYLHVLAETGSIGLLGFLVFLLGSLRTGVVATRATAGMLRIACFGLTVGIAGVLVQELTGFELLTDPVFYSFGLVVALLAKAPAIEAVLRAPSTDP